MTFFTALQNSRGTSVDPSSALKGRIVALYFSAVWCPACASFTPLLSALCAQTTDTFQVVQVSSDISENEMYQSGAGNWLYVPLDAAQRQELKKQYGVFAGKEAADFPGTKRRSGIPTLVIIAPDGTERDLLDCDNPTVLDEMRSKQASFLDRWEAYKW
jgi:thiol-disulfide isomerase/thioredoxin